VYARELIKNVAAVAGGLPDRPSVIGTVFSLGRDRMFLRVMGRGTPPLTPASRGLIKNADGSGALLRGLDLFLGAAAD
jgi:hypothetical protein